MEWISIEDRLPDVFSGKFMVETSDEMTFFCYFYSDMMGWIKFYGEKLCYWWNSTTHQPVFNVIKWKEEKK